MKTSPLFEAYQILVIGADQAFTRMQETHSGLIHCKRHCSDCCHAIFGLFLIEAAYLQSHFGQLSRKKRREALLRAEKADVQLHRLEKTLKEKSRGIAGEAHLLARERIRCPLLDEHEDCMLYPYRPITCRVYGIPTAIHGKARVCRKSGFKEGASYPAFDLDKIYGELHFLSKKMLQGSGKSHLEGAALMISVSKALRTPLMDLINETFSEPRIAGPPEIPDSTG